VTKSYAVISGTGGTGKTTIAVNLAAALHDLGENTLLVEANIHQPHIGLHLGDGLYKGTLHDVLEGRISFTRAVHYHPSGLKIVPGDLNTNRNLRYYHNFTHYAKGADHVIFDGPPGNADHILEHVDNVIIVTRPQLPALTDARRIIAHAMNNHKIIAGIILNHVTNKDLTPEQAERFLGMSIIATIPYDKKIREALTQQQPYYYLYPKRKGARALRAFAARLANKPL